MQVIKIDPIIRHTCVQFARRKELIMYSLPILFARRGKSIMNCTYLLLVCKRDSLWEQHRVYFQAQKIHNGSKSEYICKQRKEYKKSFSQPIPIWYIPYAVHWYDCYFPTHHSDMKFINKKTRHFAIWFYDSKPLYQNWYCHWFLISSDQIRL